MGNMIIQVLMKVTQIQMMIRKIKKNQRKRLDSLNAIMKTFGSRKESINNLLRNTFKG